MKSKHSIAGLLRAVVLALTLVLLLPAPAARADSLREVAERVARQHDAKVVSARVVERNGRRFYEIRILTKDGVVRTIRVPADDSKYLAKQMGVVSAGERLPERIANRSSLPQGRSAITSAPPPAHPWT